MSSVTINLLRMQVARPIRVYPSTFREEMARRLGDAPVMFHRGPNGRPQPGLPHIRFQGGKHWLGIAFDPGYEDHLYEHMGAAVQTATALAKMPVQVEVQKVETTAILDGIPRTYWVSEMVLKRRHKAARDAEIQALVEARLLASLHRFDAHHGLGVIPEDPVKAKEQLKLEVLDVVSPRGLRIITDHGQTDEYATLTDVRFRISGQLRGLWAVGNLTARAYGSVWKCLLSEEQIVAQQAHSLERKVVG